MRLARLSDAMRRNLKALASGGSMGEFWTPAARKALLDRLLAEVDPDSPPERTFKRTMGSGTLTVRTKLRITDRGREYLTSWSRAYGSGVDYRGER